jgi:predicted DNA-binding antitoxin AbrB/MazE fold protein
MVRTLQAVYEHGMLRPIEPLQLDENQLVSVIITDDTEPEEELLFARPESFESRADHSVSREAVREALSKIPGSMEADFQDERNHR